MTRLPLDDAQIDALRACLELIRDNGGTTTAEGLVCNGSWCAEQARCVLEETRPPCRDAGPIPSGASASARCNRAICRYGLELQWSGRCPVHGDWTDHDCPRFEAMQPAGMITRAVLGPDPMEVQP